MYLSSDPHSGFIMPLAQPQVQHFSAPIADMQGQPVGTIEVHKETVPVMIQEDTESMKQDTKEELVKYMMCVAGCLNELMIQAHLVHFNFCGPEFLSVHKFLKKQYQKHQEQFDKIGESIRSLDYYMPMCSTGLKEAVHDFKHCKSHTSKEMLAAYLCNLETVGMKAKCMGKLAAEACAPDVENLAADIVEVMFTDAYLVKSTLRQN